jgi:phage tail-like protein
MVNDVEFLTSSRFYVELLLGGSGSVDGSYRECTGFQYSLDVIEIAEVSPQKWGTKNATKGKVIRTKIPGNYKVDTKIVLRRCISSSMTLWQWVTKVEGDWGKNRKDGSLTICKQDSTLGAIYNFYNAWPASYVIGDVDASGNELLVEEIEMVCENLERTS